MHTIEPYYNWKPYYDCEEDECSPFHGVEYDEFRFTKKVYNFFIHPQWDDMGSQTLYLKIIFADYNRGFAVIELIGEWNDCIYNDVMFLKNDVIDILQRQGIHRFALVMENVLNFHSSDDSYYEEWNEDVSEHNGWIALLGLRDHVEADMREAGIHQYAHMDQELAGLNWRSFKPDDLRQVLEGVVSVQPAEHSG